MQRSIVHLDADAFFASVEQAADSRLRGKPIAVGGEKRGIIASASYEARRFGIFTPMPTVRARRLCPRLIVLAGDYEKYERFSRWMFSYAYDFTPDVEVGSIDEGYLDLTSLRKSPTEVAETLRRAILQSLKIPRWALGKEKWEQVEKIGIEFAVCARRLGRTDDEIAAVWKIVCGFSGYAFCKAHSTAYGVEAYQAAWLKHYYPSEFMAAVLTNGKGFYRPLVYILECHRLGIPLLPPWINDPGPGFAVRDGKIRVPVVRVKGVTERTVATILAQHERGVFVSLEDFRRRVGATGEEMELLARVGAFDGFGRSRTEQFWAIQHLARGGRDADQAWLLNDLSRDRTPPVKLTEPTRLDRLRFESELLDFPVSGHPLELHPDVAWDTYCPVSRLAEHLGETVTCCGLIIEDRVHHQVTGELMKFMTIADWTGIVETELFADTYRSYGLATVRYPVLEVTVRVEPFENGNGCSLRVLRAGKPRST